MSELHALDPRLGDALRAWQQQSVAHPRPSAMAAARSAMHQARVAERPRPRLAMLGSRLRVAMTPPQLLAGAAGLATGLAAVAVLGWNAPAGSPLHVVRLAHEDIALAVPGADRTGLDLAYAEARLTEVRQGSAPVAALDEAASLLDDARSHLPADHASPLWTRWQDDVHQLDDLRGHHPDEDGTPGAPGGAPPGGGPTSPDERGAAPGSSGGPPAGEHGGGSTSTTRTETRTESRSTTSFSTSTSSHGDGSGSSSTTTTTESRGSRSESTTATGGHDQSLGP